MITMIIAPVNLELSYHKMKKKFKQYFWGEKKCLTFARCVDVFYL